MQTLNARSCPRCDFFLGYSTTQASYGHQQTTVIGCCLNCDYQLPIRALLRGKRRPLSALAPRAGSHLTVISRQPPQLRQLARKAPLPRNCAGDLRAVGQALEQLQLKNFNLKRDGRSYLIWNRDSAYSPDNIKLPHMAGLDSTAPNYRLSAEDVERIEREGVSRRSQRFHPVDGHKLSHLLRALGTQIERRGRRLLGITWREEAVRVIVESARGRRRIEPIRSDVLYDLWVRMYLRRAR